MTWATEWQRLRRQLREEDYDSHKFNNQFYRRLVALLEDDNVGQVDLLLGYRDALLAADDPMSAELYSRLKEPIDGPSSRLLGLGVKRNGNLHLVGRYTFDDIDLRPIYALDKRRHIHEELLDPALRDRLNDKTYSRYRGRAQQLAVRIALTSKPDATMLVNLPTGCGKTLVAQALSLFSANNSLTVVIVPTIGLAIEQGRRTKELLEKAGESHAGLYFWHGGQTKAEHDEIKKRIRRQQQRVLYCSPEAACRSLLPTLFQAASSKSLSSIVVDEAHIVDQWGAEFRPYFQIVASLTRSLRQVSPNGLQCVLMSATFSNKSIRLVEELFATDGKQVIHVNGCFLRPEIQFATKKVDISDHLSHVIDAVVALPKPMIIYVLYPQQADTICRALERTGIRRVRQFTGRTPASRREELVESWAKSEFDIVVATSAFGLGMDKANVRSVVHAAVPESLDRFYQEVGRGGRDGCASQSLVIYHDRQIAEARSLNSERLITVDLGMRKWRAMWDHGKPLPNGGRVVAVSTLRSDQRVRSDRNEEWNWRTLLLMQRAGLIRIEMEQPTPPTIDSESTDQEYWNAIGEYFDNYYENIAVMPLLDGVSSERTWSRYTSARRDFEKRENSHAFRSLLRWLQNPSSIPLCRSLLDYYTVAQVQPEYACGGCPSCIGDGKEFDLPTVGHTAEASGLEYADSWGGILSGAPSHQYVYYPRGALSNKRLIRQWVGWIRRLVETNVVRVVRAEEEVLNVLATELRIKKFWIGDVLGLQSDEENMCWPQLVLYLDNERDIPRLGYTPSVTMVMGPEEVRDLDNPNRKWWQSTPHAVSLDNFLLSLDV